MGQKSGCRPTVYCKPKKLPNHVFKLLYQWPNIRQTAFGHLELIGHKIEQKIGKMW